MFPQVLLSFLNKLLHLAQISPCNAVMNGYAIQRARGNVRMGFSHKQFLSSLPEQNQYFLFSNLAISTFRASSAARTSPCSAKCCSAWAASFLISSRFPPTIHL